MLGMSAILAAAAMALCFACTYRVEHSFEALKGKNTPKALEVTVKITNLASKKAFDVRYRRMVNWDIDPTAGNEFVTTEFGDVQPNNLEMVGIGDGKCLAMKAARVLCNAFNGGPLQAAAVQCTVKILT